jgi:hypothetical protein
MHGNNRLAKVLKNVPQFNRSDAVAFHKRLCEFVDLVVDGVPVARRSKNVDLSFSVMVDNTEAILVFFEYGKPVGWHRMPRNEPIG